MSAVAAPVITLDRLRDGWEVHLEVSNRAPNTVKTYLAGLDRFLAFLEERGMTTIAGEIKPDDVRSFLLEQEDHGLKPSTRRTRCKGLISFWKWAVREPGSGVDTNPMANVDTPIVPEAEPVRVLTDDEMRALLATCNRDTFVDHRDLAILRLMDHTGMRKSEVMGMRVGDIDWKKRELEVRGKGRRHRTVRLNPKTMAALFTYDALRLAPGEDAFWLNRNRGPLARDGIPGMLERRAERAGIGHVHAHMIRHTAISNMLAAEMSEGDVCTITGTSREQLDATYAKATRSQRARDSQTKLQLGDRL